MERNRCPTSWILASFAKGQMSTDQRAAIVEHLAFCTQCHAQYLAIQEQSPERPPAAPRDQRPILVALLILVAVVLVLILFRPG